MGVGTLKPSSGDAQRLINRRHGGFFKLDVSGPAVDVQFEEATMPPIYQALRVIHRDGFKVPTPINVILEVQQHLGEGRVRTVAMEATDGMVRGMKAIDLGGPSACPWAKRRWAA